VIGGGVMTHSRSRWPINQNEFENILNKLPKVRKQILRLFLKGYKNPEIAIKISEINKKNSRTEKNVRSQLSSIYGTFPLPCTTKEELIKFFCKFQRDWVAHKLRDQCDLLRVDDYFDVENIRSDDSNFRLIEGIECLYHEDYQWAIKIFEKEIDHDPTSPIAKILLNNARAYLQTRRPFRIAVVVSYSPQNNSHVDATENVLRGIADAQTQFNESGGKDGRWLEIIIADDRNQPEVAREQARNLSDVESILAVIGHHASEGTEAALQIYAERSMALITPTSTSSNLCANNFFRTIGSTKVVARKYAQYITEYLRSDRIAIFWHPDNEYSQTLKDDFAEAFNGQIIEPIFDMRNSLLDIEGAIAEIIRRNCKTALVISSIETNKIALDIARKNSSRTSQRLNLLFSTSFPERLILERGEFIEGVVFVRPDLTEESDYMEQARNRWRQREVNWRVGTSYAAAQALLEAIRLSANTTREEILDNLQTIALCTDKTSRFGLNWSVSNDPSNTQREYCIAQIHNDTFKDIL
jgi:ABC-type branched-subunit amino acid transport system substrate-binding protein